MYDEHRYCVPHVLFGTWLCKHPMIIHTHYPRDRSSVFNQLCAQTGNDKNIYRRPYEFVYKGRSSLSISLNPHMHLSSQLLMCISHNNNKKRKKHDIRVHVRDSRSNDPNHQRTCVNQRDAGTFVISVGCRTGIN